MKKTIYTLIMSLFILLFYSCGSDNNSGTSINQAGKNLRPIAVAGDNQTVFVGDSVLLDGSNSYDPDKNYPLNYNWQIIYRPEESTTILTKSINPDNANESHIYL